METQETNEQSAIPEAVSQAFAEKLTKRLDEEVPDPDPGLTLEAFKAVAHSYQRMFQAERVNKPSRALYRAVGAKPRTRTVKLANATFAGQLLVIVSDNGGWAQRTKPNMLKITFGPEIKKTMDKLINQFKALK